METVDSLVFSEGFDFKSYWYQKGIAERRIYFNDEVDTETIEKITLPLLAMDDGSGRPIELILNTPGGDVSVAMNVCDVIDSIKTPLTVTILSESMSAGFYMLCAGANNPNVKKRCYIHSTSLIHAGTRGYGGSKSIVCDAYKFSMEQDAAVIDYIKTHSRVPESVLEEMDRKDIYLTAKQLLEYGVVDEIIGVSDGDKN